MKKNACYDTTADERKTYYITPHPDITMLSSAETKRPKRTLVKTSLTRSWSYTCIHLPGTSWNRQHLVLIIVGHIPKTSPSLMFKNSLAPAFKTLSSLSFLMSSKLRSCFPFASSSFPRRIKDFNVRQLERLSNRMHKALQGGMGHCPTVVSHP